MRRILSLERFVAAAKRAKDGLKCEVCGAPLAAEHRHVVDRPARRLLCACQACALAFDGRQPARFRSVPESTRPVFLAETLIDRLGIPVGLAFFFRPSSLGKWVAIFPSVAGATEAQLGDDAIAVLDSLSIEDDIEALLVRRSRERSSTCYVAPVALGYELTAILRQHWRGIDGGDEARAAVDELFARIRSDTEEAA
jgi:hypothetical protein